LPTICWTLEAFTLTVFVRIMYFTVCTFEFQILHFVTFKSDYVLLLVFLIAIWALYTGFGPSIDAIYAKKTITLPTSNRLFYDTVTNFALEMVIKIYAVELF
jgi:hypothetical protein